MTDNNTPEGPVDPHAWDRAAEPNPVDKLVEWNRRSWEEAQEGGPTMDVTVSIKKGNLGRTPDATLALYWHVAQANPAPIGDKLAGDMVQAIGWEIIRRWLGGVKPEMYHHQADSYYWQNLRRFAKWNGETWEATPETIAEAIKSAGLDPEAVAKVLEGDL